MKRAGDEAGDPPAKRGKLDVAALRAKLAATKAKLASIASAPRAEPVAPPPQAPPPQPVPSRPPGPAIAASVPPAAHAAAPSAARDEAPSTSYYDSRVGTSRGNAKRRARKGALSFVEKDKAMQLAELERLKGSKFGSQIARAMREKERLQKAAQMKEAAAGGVDPNLVPLGERVFPAAAPKPDVPEMERWDAVVFAQSNYDPGPDGRVPLKESKITNLVEHPVPIEPPAEAPMPPPQPLKLTTREMKKMRRQRREQREKEKQRLIQEGLLEPAKPKIKLSNMHRVLGADGVLDATAIEMEIRKASAERLAAHEDRNAARKLTTSERKEKKIKKLFGEGSPDTQVQVFRITSLKHPGHVYKVDINAKENRMTGACIITDGDINLVVVEGCPKSIRRFNRLMLKRIDWNPAQGVDEDDEDMFGEVNKCHLVWEGTVQQPAFTEFVRELCPSEHAARQVLARAGVAHYWDAAKAYQPTTEV